MSITVPSVKAFLERRRYVARVGTLCYVPPPVALWCLVGRLTGHGCCVYSETKRALTAASQPQRGDDMGINGERHVNAERGVF